MRLLFLALGVALLAGGMPSVGRAAAADPPALRSITIDLGTAVDPATGETLVGTAIAFVPVAAGDVQAAAVDPNYFYGDCYRFRPGVRWKTNEPWLVNGANASGIAPSTVLEITARSVARWEAATAGAGVGRMFDVLGSGTSTSVPLDIDRASPDGSNELYFASGAIDSNALGITYYWMSLNSNVALRRMIEWDIVISGAYPYGTAGESGRIDLESLLMHELGHVVGMGDIYNDGEPFTGCQAVTMFGSLAYGSTAARSLDPRDIEGIYELYLIPCARLDVTGDARVDLGDPLAILPSFGAGVPAGHVYDVNDDQMIDLSDALEALALFGWDCAPGG